MKNALKEAAITPEVLPKERTAKDYQEVLTQALEVADRIKGAALDGYREMGEVVALADRSGGGKEWIRQLSDDLKKANLGVSVASLYKMQKYRLNVTADQHEVLKLMNVSWRKASELGQDNVSPQVREKVVTDLESGRMAPEEIGAKLKDAKPAKKSKDADDVDADAGTQKDAGKRMSGIARFTTDMEAKLKDLSFKVVQAVREGTPEQVESLAKVFDEMEAGFDLFAIAYKRNADPIKASLERRLKDLSAQKAAEEKAKKVEAKKPEPKKPEPKKPEPKPAKKK